ncbi:alpha/beta hydrolase [Microcella humidisoli]|uniref:Alpha/beta hydrolase n=1 Tax=Microcella humidisoli TaxID=2963406 RepID=A0ABY5FZ78_9MICO|nr:alpha/beta hydrolase [Microcella humidisoli]UTT63627.1 alpha/beta hydrolase [Microcella humidisoli]
MTLRERTAALARPALVVVGGLAALGLALVALGALAPALPLLGLAGRWHVLTLGGWGAAAGLALAAGLAGLARGGRRSSARLAGRAGRRVTAGLAALALIASSVLASALATTASFAAAQGATVSAFGFASGGPSLSAAPDASQVYLVDDDGRELRVDVYLPGSAAPREPLPAVVVVHGGGWMLHDRTRQSDSLRRLADSGLVVLAIDYTLATRNRPTWNIAGDQVACALVWTAEHADRYGVDARRIVLAGSSAGGGLALTTGYRAAAGTATSACGGAVPVPAGVAGAVPVVDPAGFHANPDPFMSRYSRTMTERYLGGAPGEHPDRIAATTTLTHLAADAPPTLLLTVEHDHLVPADGARELAAAALALGVPVERVEVPFADHGVLVPSTGVGASIWRAALLRFALDVDPVG